MRYSHVICVHNVQSARDCKLCTHITCEHPITGFSRFMSVVQGYIDDVTDEPFFQNAKKNAYWTHILELRHSL